MKLLIALVSVLVPSSASAFCFEMTKFDWADKVIERLDYMTCEHNDLVGVVNSLSTDVGDLKGDWLTTFSEMDRLQATVAEQADLIEALEARIDALECAE